MLLTTPKMMEPHPWFAWYPVHTKSGWVWLEKVNRTWNGVKFLNAIDPYDPGEYGGGWEYERM